MPASVHRTWTSTEAPAVLQARLRSLTEPIEGGFKLMHRLSGAGVVVRTLEAPETSRPLFGKVHPDRFSVSLVPHASDITPFHPIVRGTIAEGPTGGATVTAELAHHPNARTFAPLYAFGAVALAVGAIVGARDRPTMLFGGLTMALLFASFPTLQARVRFQQSVDRAEVTFRELLGMDGAA